MLRMAGIILILLAGAGMGYAGSKELTMREKNLRQFLQLIIYLRGEIRCGCASLPEGFRETADRFSGVYREFLREVSQRLGNPAGGSMGEIYRQCAEAKLKRLELSREGRLGYLDREMQLRQLELCEEETRRRLEDLRKEMPDKKKIYQSLGVLGGILLAVLLW